MNISSRIIGCDISKAKIDVFDAASGRHDVFTNDPAGIAHLLARHAGGDARFVFEATGAYGALLRAALAKAGLAAIEVNPLHGRRFAQAKGRLAKTDRIDAALLAEMASRLDLAETAPWDETREELKALITRRDQLVQMRADEMRRRAQTRRPAIQASLARGIQMLDQEIAGIEHEIETARRRDAEVDRRFARLATIPGVGPAIPTVLAALAPELGAARSNAIAALAGIAPMARESGAFVGKRSITGGRPRLRRALYQAALSASRGRSRLGEKYRQLRAAGKPPKVALIAIARKIATIANAMIRDDKPFA